MSASFRELHDELRSVARGLLGAQEPGAPAAWADMAEAGWLGLEVDEAHGGAGATFAEVVVIAEELGRARVASAALGSVVLGVGVVASLEPDDETSALLGALATGDTKVAVALTDGSRDTVAGGPVFRVERSPGAARLHGRAEFVPDALAADHLVLLAVDEAGPVAIVLPPGSPGLTVVAQPTLDSTREVAVVTADGVALGPGSVRRFAGDPQRASRVLADRLSLALAADSVGVARSMLDATVAYAAQRHQFGRPIGSFQAVKHACADALVQISMAAELVDRAVAAIVDDAPEASVAASMAKAHATAIGVDVAGMAMQLHGGVGYAWESGVHLALKRAALNRALAGSPAAHRRWLAGRYRAATTPTIGAM